MYTVYPDFILRVLSKSQNLNVYASLLFRAREVHIIFKCNKYVHIKKEKYPVPVWARLSVHISEFTEPYHVTHSLNVKTKHLQYVECSQSTFAANYKELLHNLFFMEAQQDQFVAVLIDVHFHCENH